MKVVSASELLGHLRSGRAPAILDVRTAGEYSSGHVPGAVNFSFWVLFFRPPPMSVAPDQLLVVYCGHGPRARLAATALGRWGFSELIELEGHMSAWRRAGLPESTGSEPGAIG